MSKFKELRSYRDRRQAPLIKLFPILDSSGCFVEHDRRSGNDRRTDSSTTLQFIEKDDFLASLSDQDL